MRVQETEQSRITNKGKKENHMKDWWMYLGAPHPNAGLVNLEK